jgi:hypothetical protein
MSTVKDDKLPELSGHVRANLMLSGWKFEKVDAGVAITYVNHIDLAGSIPSSFLKGLQLQVPLCAGKVVSYVQDYGFAPTTTQCTANFKTEEFDHAKREYVAQIDGEGEVSWIISKTMYPNGVKTVAGSAAVDTKDQEDGNQVLTVKVNGPLTVKITKA